MNETPVDPTTKPTNRRLFRWLLAAMVLAVMITAIAIALPVYRDHQAAVAWSEIDGSIWWSDDDSLARIPESNRLAERFNQLVPHVAVAYYVKGEHEMRELLPIISDFRRLDVLMINNTAMTSSNLRQIAVYQPELRTLGLSLCWVSDNTLSEIGRLQRLTQLNLSRDHITDTGLSHISKLENLEILGLSSTEITDEGLWHLRTLKNLRELDVSNTLVTDEGVERLRAEIPGLEVWDD
ncbi:leucine-rich repeat domain-containing protein [Thalassoroseus pseudoceratinae]|uniref:hypothetical protein n=1 Tax=Thalassoroseus pseudoceratinae TaxID=2713176 RepID=UPI001423D36A|nr:hypothetical protein [Thalassoroseus pseudoceratinae]